MTTKNYSIPRTALLTLAFSFASLVANHAHAAVTSAFDGNWYDPATIGQGFIFETYPGEKGELSIIVVYFSYDTEGRPTFFTATGPVTEGSMSLPLLMPITGRQISPGVFEPPRFAPTGKLELNFDNCNVASAVVQFDSSGNNQGITSGPVAKIRVGTGSFKLQRLGGSIQAKRCTGGISDNTFAGDAAVGFEQFINTPQFGARAVFEKRPDASDFRLEFRDLPVGSYSLALPNESVKQFNALPFGTSTKAKVHFRSPALDQFAPLLSFDVSGKSFTVQGIDRNNKDIRQIFSLTSELSPLGLTNGTASAELSVNERFNLAQVRGQATAASASFILDTQYDRSATSEEFKISVEGAEPGMYDVYIDNVRRAPVNIKNQPDLRASGEVFFRSPVTVGSYPLDFDPRGVSVELRRGGIIEFGATLRQ